METRSGRFACAVAATAALSWLSGCGGGGDANEAEISGARAGPLVAGSTPFIAFMPVDAQHLATLASVNFTIAAQAGMASRPVNVTYSADYLNRHGYLQSTAIQVPVFGLYAGVQNAVTLTLVFADQSTLTLPTASFTPAADGVQDIYTTPGVAMARKAGSDLGFDYFYIKSQLGPPVIVDSDGKVRWRASVRGLNLGTDTTFDQGAFVTGDDLNLYRIELDGTYDGPHPIQDPGVLDFHHDMEVGKSGDLADVDVVVNGVRELESVAEEITPAGTVLKSWDMVKILRDYMSAHGDDPDLFVRTDVDWFHMNTAVYDARDGTLLVSSRENAIFKIDYETGDILWILGDPTKYWYTFPSLRAKALTLASGLWPIGQHGVNIAPDGNMLLFNNGQGSMNQPPGAPPGDSRTYSEASSYAIDEAARSATQVWGFDYGQAVFSPYCGSAQQVADGSALVDFATAEQGKTTYIVGLNPAHQVVFDYRYPNTSCTSWNAQPIALEAMALQ
jgi:hypothetical protein